ncbi:hypothetical protein ACLX1H_010567 [Fusarium chlamydosporum]
MAKPKLQGVIALVLALVALMTPGVLALPDLHSITKGSGSKGTVGYRGPLRKKLLGKGISVDMIGTLTDGNMDDNDHEGHSGKYLADINGWWQKPTKARPNVVLIHAGTNNMDKEVDLDIAIDIMTKMVDGIFKAAPDATVFIAPVIWANNPKMQANTDRFNPQIRALVNARQNSGKHILEVPMDITLSDLWDLKHPNDQGYEKMANAWLKAIIEADSRGWLKAPVKMTSTDAPGTGLGIGGEGNGGTAVNIWKKEGTIFDGFRTWEEIGTISGPLNSAGRVILADLDGDGMTDYVVADNDGTVRAWIYQGSPNDWKSLGKVNPDWSSITGEMIRLADVDNDGKADLIVLYSDGAAKVWKNTKDGAKFEALDAKWATGLASREKVHFEDIDGDGYADYVIVYSGGSVQYARNTHNNGKDSKKKNWEEAETIAPGPAGMPANSARLRDLDGDGRAGKSLRSSNLSRVEPESMTNKKTDYLVVYDGGAVKAWRNSGKLNKGGGSNWHELGTVVPGVSGVTGDMIRFADMDGDGLADFLAVAKDGSIRMWKNLGIVGVKGKSLRFADIDGDGRADIMSVDGRGRTRAWLNKKGKFDDIGEISPGFNNDMSSARIEFADVDGDGLADYLIIYGGGAVKAYLNNGNIGTKNGKGIWKQGITISPGVGEPGAKVRFADLDGDGTADYIIMYDGGAAKAYLNMGNIGKNNGERLWRDGSEIATGVGVPGSKIRFADLTGDKRADYIVQYDGGAAKGYRNLGNIPKVGKGRAWNLMGTVAGGVSPQGPVHYADINGDGKADYLVVFDGGAINAYVNDYDWKRKLPGEGDNDKDDDGKDDDNPDEKPDPEPCGKKTYSDKHSDREGEYNSRDGNKNKGRQYVNIVNLTPHTFKFDADGSNEYQMHEWDWGDIPPGQSRQNVADYSTAVDDWLVDTKGEAYYTLEGTSKKFAVRATTNVHDKRYNKRFIFDLSGMGAGQCEFKAPGKEVPLTLVITGSEYYGFITSLKFAQGNWMKMLESTIWDRQLTEIVMPGTHDSGMGKLTSAILTGASDTNTKTQALTINNQLWAGARWFDLRVMSVHDTINEDSYEFFTAHMSGEEKDAPIGRSGESLDDVIDGIVEFTKENPGEVIILQFRYLIGIRKVPSRGPIYWDDGIKEEFFDKLRKIDNLCGGLYDTGKKDETIEKLYMGDLMDKNDGKGCVLAFLDTKNLDNKISKAENQISRKDGIYHYDDFSWTDAWPNTVDMKEAAEFNIDDPKFGWKNWKTFHLAQWLATPNHMDSTFVTSVQEYAISIFNPTLYWKGVPEMTPVKFPNVIMVDYIGVRYSQEHDWKRLTPELQTLVIGLNLYTISENCNIHKRRSPLLPPSGSARLDSRPPAQSWDGVIFANGTELEFRPPDIHLGCSSILKKGTVFGNGTILLNDTTNPACPGGSGMQEEETTFESSTTTASLDSILPTLSTTLTRTIRTALRSTSTTMPAFSRVVRTSSTLLPAATPLVKA